MRGALIAVLLVGCGRLGFEHVGPTTTSDAAGSSDGTTPDAASTAAMVVQGTALPLTMGMSAAVPIAKTTAGDLVVVGVTQETNTTAIVSQITDDAGNTYVSANQRSVDTSCNNTAEIWYAAAVHADASSITVTMSASVTIEVWALELAGPGPNPVDTGAVASTQPSGATIPAPTVVVSSAGEAVISTAATCGAISQLKAGSPFTALAIENGENTAYYITPAPGSYGAVWSYGGGSWNASTVAFK